MVRSGEEELNARGGLDGLIAVELGAVVSGDRGDGQGRVSDEVDRGSVELGDGRWLIEVVDPRSEAESIAKTLIGANAPIYELSPTQRDLETVFREVNEEVVSDAV